jgi:iron complex outermembrane receptor protein
LVIVLTIKNQKMKKLTLVLLLQFAVVFAFAQFSLKGTVKNEAGERLPGTSVVIAGTFQGASSDLNGNFEFKNLKGGTYSLQFSFIGYESQIVKVELSGNKVLDVVMKPNPVMTEEVLISATRANNKMPVAFTTVGKKQIQDNNMGQDIPYLLSQTPSFVVTSDAGAGVGYTNFRIRGTDLNRINVTINGIPMNDAESHGTWWVDIPDLAASTDNIQVQRGVGTSTNGAAAFGASINLQTMTLNKDAHAEYTSAAGSFNTFKNTVSAGSGLINGKYTFDARLSRVKSDGFIDRASSDLKSFFVSGGYFTENTILKTNIFSGFEETYQAWWGVPSVRLNNDFAGMQRYADHGLYTQQQVDEMVNSNNRTYNYYTYPNQVDHYQQDHYQLLYSHRFDPTLHLNAALFYTRGKGYYEEYKEGESYNDYLMTAPVINGTTLESTDLVRRKWLDNDFYGGTFSLNSKTEAREFTFGGGYNVYDGDHYGNVIWARFYGDSGINHEWYRGNGLKKDFNLFARYNYEVVTNLNLFVDFQYRSINYSISGIDDDLRDLTQEHQFEFFNPKVGLFYHPNDREEIFFNFARASREPNRNNYVDADANHQPVEEVLNDFEFGYNYKNKRIATGANLYYMLYQNQLVLTGQINDVGSPIMENFDDSYRAGIELTLAAKLTSTLRWDINATFSRNKIKNFTEYVDDWDNGGQQQFDLGTTDLSFSPNVIANSQLVLTAMPGLNLSLQSNYVGKQYIDNTSNEDRKLDAYVVNNLKLDYILKQKLFKEVKLHAQVNNLLNAEYESNAWVYSYILNGKRFKMDGYFPQAGTNVMFGIDFSF